MGQEEEGVTVTVAEGEEEEGEEGVRKERKEGKEDEACNQMKQTLIMEISSKLINGDLETKIEAARDIRKLVRKSSSSSSSSSPSPSSSSSGKTRSKLGAAGVIQPLVLMLVSPNPDAREAALLALLNLAVRDERSVLPLFQTMPSFGF